MLLHDQETLRFDRQLKIDPEITDDVGHHVIREAILYRFHIPADTCVADISRHHCLQHLHIGVQTVTEPVAQPLFTDFE